MKKWFLFGIVLLILSNVYALENNNLPNKEQIKSYTDNLIESYQTYFELNKLNLQQNYEEYFFFYPKEGRSFLIKVFSTNENNYIVLYFKPIVANDQVIEINYNSTYNDENINLSNANGPFKFHNIIVDNIDTAKRYPLIISVNRNDFFNDSLRKSKELSTNFFNDDYNSYKESIKIQQNQFFPPTPISNIFRGIKWIIWIILGIGGILIFLDEVMSGFERVKSILRFFKILKS
jgi:hypothetical protein